MMSRTHLAITVLAVLLFLPHISSLQNKFVFSIAALIATYIPDVDSGFSTAGRMKASRVVQFFVKHRGIFHSFTFCIAVSLLFAAIIPVLALPFFLGYGLHLFADSFTLEGIRPLWPSRMTSNWKIRTGSVRETGIFIFIVFIDLLVLVLSIKSII